MLDKLTNELAERNHLVLDLCDSVLHAVLELQHGVLHPDLRLLELLHVMPSLLLVSVGVLLYGPQEIGGHALVGYCTKTE